MARSHPRPEARFLDITDRQKLLRENFSPVFFNELDDVVPCISVGHTFED